MGGSATSSRRDAAARSHHAGQLGEERRQAREVPQGEAARDAVDRPVGERQPQRIAVHQRRVGAGRRQHPVATGRRRSGGARWRRAPGRGRRCRRPGRAPSRRRARPRLATVLRRQPTSIRNVMIRFTRSYRGAIASNIERTASTFSSPSGRRLGHGEAGHRGHRTNAPVVCPNRERGPPAPRLPAMSARPHFSIARIPVRVEPAFLLVSFLFGLPLPRFGLDIVLVWVACSFVSILVHELGHGLALKVFGQPSVIVLHGFGGVTISQRRSSARARQEHHRERGWLAHGPAPPVAAGADVASIRSSTESIDQSRARRARSRLLGGAVPRLPEPVVVGRQPAAGAPAGRGNVITELFGIDRARKLSIGVRDRRPRSARSSTTRPTAASSSSSWRS